MEPWRSRDIYGRGGELGLGRSLAFKFFYFYFIIMRFRAWFLMIPPPLQSTVLQKTDFVGGFFFSSPR